MLAFVRFPHWLLSLLLFAAWSATSPTVHAQPLEEVTVLTPAPPTLPGFAPWLLAQSRGYYREQGLKVNLVAANGGGVQVAKMVGAGTALAGSSVADAPMFLRPNGIPIKVVAVLGGRSLMQVAVHADNDKIKTPADLRGKTITAGSYTDSIFYSFIGMMSGYGITRNQMDIQAAGPAGVWQVFASGKADAMIGTPDWIIAAQNAGAKIKVFRGEDYFPSLPQAIVVSEKIIAERPELVRKLVSATLRAMQDVIDDPKAAADEFVRLVPAYAGKEAYVNQIIQAYAKDVYPGQKTIGKMDVPRLRTLQDFYVKQGFLPSAKPLSDFYTDRFVESSP